MLGLGAGLACGLLNTAAGSGSAVSLPLLMLLGVDPLSANATNRIPVLIGSISGVLSFHRRRSLPVGLALKVCLPSAFGSVVGASVAELLPSRKLGLVITGAVLIVLALLFTRIKKALQEAGADVQQYSWRESLVFFALGIWLGFIVIDGATYILFALTLAMGVNLVHANAIKSAVLIPTTLIAMSVFAYNGNINWKLGAIMGVGSAIGGVFGARLTMSARAHQYVVGMLVLVISGELIHLVVHYVFETH